MQNEMRDRLIELLKAIEKDPAITCPHWNENDCFNCPYDKEETCDMEARKADYLLANGAILPPVEVGQTVWYIKGGYYNSIHKKAVPIKVTEISKKWWGKNLSWGFIANSTRYRFSSIGKTVFLTEQEAREALRKEDEGK